MFISVETTFLGPRGGFDLFMSLALVWWSSVGGLRALEQADLFGGL